MKKWFVLMLALICLVPSAQAEGLADFLSLTGLASMQAAENAIVRVEYSSGTKLEHGFSTTDEEEIARLAQAVYDLKIIDTTDQFVTDMYPAIAFYLADGTQYALHFDGKWLQVDGKNYVLDHDAPFWAAVDALLQKYSDQQIAPFQPNSTDIYLPSNPTTGFEWQYSVDVENVICVTDQYFAEQSEIPLSGLGGTHWFHFDGLHPGVAAVTLTYARPWEEGAVSEIVFRVTVDEALNVLIWGVEWVK